jgi:hypothetical protein
MNNIIRFAKNLIAKFDADFESLKSLQTIPHPTKIEAFDTEFKVNNSIFLLPSFSAWSFLSLKGLGHEIEVKFFDINK